MIQSEELYVDGKFLEIMVRFVPRGKPAAMFFDIDVNHGSRQFRYRYNLILRKAAKSDGATVAYYKRGGAMLHG